MTTKYERALREARIVARQHGYALAVHGSEQRDLDLIAAPWVDDAAAPEVLAKAIEVAVDGFVLQHRDPERTPTPKPHGRLAWSIHLGGGPYLDLSVMPRLEAR